MKLKPNRTQLQTYNNREYRDLQDSGYHRSFNLVHRERASWFDYLDQFSELSIPHRNRRSYAAIPDCWDIEPVAYPKLVHPRSWKAHYKCRKQWMKNL